VSACQRRQVDVLIIAQGRDGFQRHLASPLDRPFVVSLEQDRSNEPDYRVLVGEDANDVGSPLRRSIGLVLAANMADNSRATKGGQMIRYRQCRLGPFPNRPGHDRLSTERLGGIRRHDECDGGSSQQARLQGYAGDQPNESPCRGSIARPSPLAAISFEEKGRMDWYGRLIFRASNVA
jgi:hypothetical protein